MEKILCSIREAASALSVGRSKIYDLMNEGALESIKIGQRRLIRVASIAAYTDTLGEVA